ncbi:DUF2065 domain-containing protein [Rheinheimera sp.]|uniref:DUF2065 domain-containing protein n=1 Tax=Rheinheimera sp. TaxID=1869214 RepID=UPI00307DAC7D
MSEFWLAALGLVLLVEGLGPLLFPNRWRRYLLKIAAQDSASLQQLGGSLVLAGVLLLYFFLS